MRDLVLHHLVAHPLCLQAPSATDSNWMCALGYRQNQLCCTVLAQVDSQQQQRLLQTIFQAVAVQLQAQDPQLCLTKTVPCLCFMSLKSIAAEQVGAQNLAKDYYQAYCHQHTQALHYFFPDLASLLKQPAQKKQLWSCLQQCFAA